MVRIQLRGWKRGILFALCLLSFLARGAVGIPDLFDDENEMVHSAFRNANVWSRNLYLKCIRGIPLTDNELNMHTAVIEHLTNYKFEDIALTNLTYSIDIREKIPGLLDQMDRGESLKYLSTALQVLRDLYRFHERVGNQDDVETLESERDELAKLFDELSKRKLNTPEIRALFADIDTYSELSIRESLKNLYQRKPLEDGEGNPVPLSEGKKFSNLRCEASIPRFENVHDIKKEMNEFRERIRQHAIGQPEMEEALVRMELQRRMGYKAEAPQKLWAMGLPGVGKDTYVNAMALAIHPQDPLAHRKHVHSMQVCKSSADIWSVFGSGKGYVGSQSLPTFIHFVVQHSGGKYHIEKDAAGYEIVVPGPDPKVKYFSPHEGIVFVNEFHDWDTATANDILKQFIERGRIPVNGSGGNSKALKEIYVPIRIIVASNDGIDLLRPRNFALKGPSSYEKILERWKVAATDTDLIRSRIVNRNDNVRKSATVKGRLSDEFMSRFSDSELLLLRPLTREDLAQIARLSLSHLSKIMKGFSRSLGGVSFEFSDSAIDTLVAHHTRADDGARRLNGGIEDYFHSVLLDAVADGKIRHSEEPRRFLVNFEQDVQGNVILLLDERSSGERHQFVVAHAEPVIDLFNPAYQKRFDDFEEHFNQKIFGAQHLAKQIRESLFLTEHYRETESARSARKFALLGLSSTGKTQTAKEIARFYYKDAQSLETIAFDGVNHEEQLKRLIYGEVNGDPSPFMEAYDRNNGKLVILLDEVANIRDPIILKSLYRILDEAVVEGFNDGKPRAMEGVVFVLTGNAGQEAFNSIPKHLPSRVQRQAQLDIYEKIQNDPHTKRQLAEKYFPQALYNRVGDMNTHFMAPLSHEALRLLMHDKVGDALRRINLSLAKRGAELSFQDEDTYVRFIEAAEEHFFDVWGQGRSVDDFAVSFEQRVLTEISIMGVEEGADLTLALDRVSEVQVEDRKRGELHFICHDGTKKHEFFMRGLNSFEKVKESKAQLLQTAIHEAGHEIARQALSNAHEKAVRISIVPGLTTIDGEFVYYPGIAVSETIERRAGTREQFVNRLARLYAGAEAQRLVNKGGVDDMGQSNDIMRADTYAAMALLSGGVDPDWGLDAPHQGESVEDYLKRQPATKLEKFEKAKAKIKNDARNLARQLLRNNIKPLMSLGRELAKRGEMSGEDLEAFYREHPVRDFRSKGWVTNFVERWRDPLVWKSALWGMAPARGDQAQMMRAYVEDPENSEVKHPDEILREKKAAAVRNLPRSRNLKFSCRSLLAM